MSISPATKAAPRPSCSSPTSASSTASTPTSRPQPPETVPSKQSTDRAQPAGRPRPAGALPRPPLLPLSDPLTGHSRLLLSDGGRCRQRLLAGSRSGRRPGAQGKLLGEAAILAHRMARLLAAELDEHQQPRTPGVLGCELAIQTRRERLTGIIGARRAWTVSMISVLDALEIDRGDAEVGMAELALDDKQRHPFAGHLDGMGVAELMRREASPHTGLAGHAAQPG